MTSQTLEADAADDLARWLAHRLLSLTLTLSLSLPFKLAVPVPVSTIVLAFLVVATLAALRAGTHNRVRRRE